MLPTDLFLAQDGSEAGDSRQSTIDYKLRSSSLAAQLSDNILDNLIVEPEMERGTEVESSLELASSGRREEGGIELLLNMLMIFFGVFW